MMAAASDAGDPVEALEVWQDHVPGIACAWRISDGSADSRCSRDCTRSTVNLAEAKDNNSNQRALLNS
jgi:hypothetical protein